jgi:hypothetical protein
MLVRDARVKIGAMQAESSAIGASGNIRVGGECLPRSAVSSSRVAFSSEGLKKKTECSRTV